MTSPDPPYPPPGFTTSSAALSMPRRSPPAAWPAASAARSRSASGRFSSRAAWYARAIASSVARPTRMFPCTAKPCPTRWLAWSKQRFPVNAAAFPFASTRPICRSSAPGSPATSRRTTSSAGTPCESSRSASSRQATFASAWVATAPTPARAAGTMAPTAGNFDWTATPI